jgi:hypothetical protein
MFQRLATAQCQEVVFFETVFSANFKTSQVPVWTPYFVVGAAGATRLVHRQEHLALQTRSNN